MMNVWIEGDGSVQRYELNERQRALVLWILGAVKNDNASKAPKPAPQEKSCPKRSWAGTPGTGYTHGYDPNDE